MCYTGISGNLHTGHHSLRRRGWWFCVSAISNEGVGSIRKNLTALKTVSIAAGVVIMAASFFVLRGCCKKHAALSGRVEDLEYDRLCEAYRREGYEVN